MQKYVSQSGLEMVPAGPHKPCNVGSNPTPATHRDVAQVVARVIHDNWACSIVWEDSDLEHDEQKLIERRTEFDVYIINKKTTYNARDGTDQTKWWEL